MADNHTTRLLSPTFNNLQIIYNLETEQEEKAEDEACSSPGSLSLALISQEKQRITCKDLGQCHLYASSQRDARIWLLQFGLGGFSPALQGRGGDNLAILQFCC